jgi:citrate lyase subunit beta/citryl-CoA lyase
VTSRCYQYVPADQPDKLAKAPTRGADALIADLEDAVAPAAKPAARRALAHWLDGQVLLEDAPVAHPEIWVRINSTADGAPPHDDLAVAVHPAVTGIVAAKCESPVAVRRLDEAISEREAQAGIPAGRTAVAALVETATGLLALAALAACPRIVRFQLGEADLVAALGMSPGPDRAELLPLRLALVVHSVAAGLDAPVGPVHTGLADLGELDRSTRALARLGFVGRAAVHPAQIPVINAVFTPTTQEVASAAAVVARFDEAAEGARGVVVAADGSLVDEAVVRSARSTLTRARSLSRRSDPHTPSDQHGTV